MEKRVPQNNSFLRSFSDQIHYFVMENFPNDWILVFQIAFKVLLLVAFIVFLDIVLKGVLRIFKKPLENNLKSAIVQALYRARVLNALVHVFSVGAGFAAIPSILYRHPKSFTLLDRSLALILVLVFAIMYQRILKAVESYYQIKKDYYRITAIRAITQSLNIIGLIIFIFIGISVSFGVSKATIVGSLSAMTAVILLIFRDTILGFVTGIHVSTSKNVKVGDWIGIPKYSIEGTIMDINLLTTKIQNFDKTISTIPTYDLMSTEIKNHQVMAEGNSRRIKKSIAFNVRSFQFINDELFAKLKNINLISDYLEEKQKELLEERRNVPHSEIVINGRQLTNIGVFRKYAQRYLEENPRLDKDEVILVRQLDISPQGMPLEIYCFANRSDMVYYEEIQADIFDHLLSAAGEFELEVLQITKI